MRVRDSWCVCVCVCTINTVYNKTYSAQKTTYIYVYTHTHNSRYALCQKRTSLCQKKPDMCQKKPNLCQNRPNLLQKRPTLYQKRHTSCTFLLVHTSLRRRWLSPKETYAESKETYYISKEASYNYLPQFIGVHLAAKAGRNTQKSASYQTYCMKWWIILYYFNVTFLLRWRLGISTFRDWWCLSERVGFRV